MEIEPNTYDDNKNNLVPILLTDKHEIRYFNTRGVRLQIISLRTV